MHKSLIWKCFGALASALVTAGSLALDLSQLVNFDTKFLSIAFLSIFCLLTFWIILDLYKANSILMGNKPSITVKCLEEHDIYYLSVFNQGEKGKFKAQIQLTSQDPTVSGLNQYNGFWKLANTWEAEILKGQTDSIVIASKNYSHSSSSIYLSFPHNLVSNNLSYCNTSSYWIGATIKSIDGTIKPLTKHDYFLTITISSNPSLREDYFIKKYRLNVSEFVEVVDKEA